MEDKHRKTSTEIWHLPEYPFIGGGMISPRFQEKDTPHIVFVK